MGFRDLFTVLWKRLPPEAVVWLHFQPHWCIVKSSLRKTRNVLFLLITKSFQRFFEIWFGRPVNFFRPVSSMDLYFLTKLNVHKVLHILPVSPTNPSDFVKPLYSRISLIHTWVFSFLVNLINLRNTFGDFVFFVMGRVHHLPCF